MFFQWVGVMFAEIRLMSIKKITGHFVEKGYLSQSDYHLGVGSDLHVHTLIIQ